MKTRFYQWLAGRLPRQLVWFVGVRIWAHASYELVGVDQYNKLTMDKALQRWKAEHPDITEQTLC